MISEFGKSYNEEDYDKYIAAVAEEVYSFNPIGAISAKGAIEEVYQEMKRKSSYVMGLVVEIYNSVVDTFYDPYCVWYECIFERKLRC